MSLFPWLKGHGTENDFVILPDPDGSVHGELDAALVREIAEELGCRVEVTAWLPGTVPIGDAHELAVATCLLREGDPVPVEHDATRWLSAAQLGDVDWLEPDRPFLLPLRAVLEAG